MAAPFITAQDLVDHLGRGVASDPGLVIAVDSACDIVRNWTGQPINLTASATVVLDGTGTDALLLPGFPIVTVRSVTVDGTVVTDYVLRSDGTLIRSQVSEDVVPSWPEGRQNITVVYDHGWAIADVPADLAMVAVMIAARIAVQGPLLQESLGQTSVRYAMPALDLTSGEKAILRNYKRAL